MQDPTHLLRSHGSGGAGRLPAARTLVHAESDNLYLDLPNILRKYAVLAVLLGALGAGAGFFAVALFSPVYKVKARLEVQPITSSVLRVPTIDGDRSEVDLQTEAQIILSGTFLRKVIQRVQLESVPAIPVQN